ncbi:hypothetical protein HMPREF0239_00682 [Clostridium sp. ATCC BAA-442]|nr:hypothetical protein HMPREF0239_00682 [Clostridium sp. ATCC BAA-442]
MTGLSAISVFTSEMRHESANELKPRHKMEDFWDLPPPVS